MCNTYKTWTTTIITWKQHCESTRVVFPTPGQHLQNKRQINKGKNKKKVKQKFSKSKKTTLQQKVEHKNTQEITKNKT